MTCKHLLLAAIAAATMTGTAQAAPADNSLQKPHLYFGQVQLGTYKNLVDTLRNGTGKPYKIRSIELTGAGGNIFRNPQAKSTCHVGVVLKPGTRCTLDVRARGIRLGWHRAVLRVTFSAPWSKQARRGFASAELRAHVVAA